MKTRLLTTTLLALSLSFLLAACPETTVRPDFGVVPARLDKAEWEGLWMPAGSTDNDNGFVFSVIDSAQGKLVALGQEPKAKPLQVSIRVASEPEEPLCFLTYAEKGDEQHLPLHLVRRQDDDCFTLWSLNHEEVERALKAGELKGRQVPGDKEDHKHSELATDPANYSKLLEPRFWQWSEPQAFIRQLQPKKP